jgi:hypothetical protein
VRFVASCVFPFSPSLEIRLNFLPSFHLFTHSPHRRIFNFLGRPAADSAKNYVYAALVDTDQYEPEGGAFVSLTKVIPPSKFVRSEEGKEVSEKLFEEMKEEWRKVDPEAVKRVFE